MKRIILINGLGQQWVYDQLPSWQTEITYRRILQMLNIPFQELQTLFMEGRNCYFLLDDSVRKTSIPTMLDSITLNLVDSKKRPHFYQVSSNPY